jgi:hypothetical protein
VVAIALAAGAGADFYKDQAVSVNGFAGLSSDPKIEDTAWGTWVDQGMHYLDGQSTFWDNIYGPGYPVYVESEITSPYSVNFTFDFSGFVASDYSYYTINIFGLKVDGTLSYVTVNQGVAGTDGNGVSWQGSGAELSQNPILQMTIYQVPAPGALALLGAAGLARSRRRRA